MKTIVAAALIVLGVTLTGCSDEQTASEPAQDQPTQTQTPEQQVHNAPIMTEADIQALLAPVPKGCDPYIILDTRSAVDTYVSAGDYVITDPGGNFGVKVTDSDPKCAEHYAASFGSAMP